MGDGSNDRDTVAAEDGIEIISVPTTVTQLQAVAERTFGDLGLLEAVVDV